MDDANTTYKKRLFAWVEPDLHNKAKALAALSNKSLQVWVEETVKERIQKEGGIR